ncbi:hypothetical protein LINPERHAP1_LOCUS37655 [Linum perenne]
MWKSTEPGILNRGIQMEWLWKLTIYSGNLTPTLYSNFQGWGHSRPFTIKHGFIPNEETNIIHCKLFIICTNAIIHHSRNMISSRNHHGCGIKTESCFCCWSWRCCYNYQR